LTTRHEVGRSNKPNSPEHEHGNVSRRPPVDARAVPICRQKSADLHRRQHASPIARGAKPAGALPWVAPIELGEELESNVADITNGNSGGSIWGVWNGDQRVVGVVSGEESEYQILQGHEDNNVFGSGSGLGNLIAWAQTNWE
jgi:hypothetical protein